MPTEQSKGTSRSLKAIHDEVLLAFGQAIDLRDNETAGHSLRVTRYSREIAKAIGCSAEELKIIALGAYLHDIGKIAIPDAILHKPGKLTPEETEVMRSHAWIGHNIVSRVSFLISSAEIVLSHHERFAGDGYPQGLERDKIPLGARIFAVADTLDAITVDRPYRKAAPFSSACEEILRESGRQFDPKVVEAFISIPEQEIRGIISAEIRRYARVPVRVAVHCDSGKTQYTTRTVDLGEGGMLLENANGLVMGQEFEINFRLDDKSGVLNMTAQILRRELPDRIGVKLLNPTPAVQKAIRMFIANHVQI
ncbi:MAG: HD domain-containing phosphohydrolase [Terriglobia bacterium]